MGGNFLRRHSLHLISAGFLVSSAAAIYAAFCWAADPGARNTHTETRTLPAGHAELGDLLGSLRRAWNPKERQRLLEEARGQAAMIEGAVHWYLARPESEQFIAVSELAVALHLRSTRPLLASIAAGGNPVVGLTALRAAHALEPYTWNEIASLLDGPTPQVVAALECTRPVKDRKGVPIADLLGDPDPAVRAAALEALPRELDRAAITLVMGYAGVPELEIAETALAALARIVWDERTAAAATDLFADAPTKARCLLLDKVAADRKPWLPVELLWRTVQEDGPMEVRTRAFRCLELLGGVPAEDIAFVQDGLPPVLRLHAARCLLAERPREAVEILLELADLDISSDLSNQSARLGARQVLTKITGTQLHHGPEAWRAWFDGHPEFAVPDLPPAPLSN